MQQMEVWRKEQGLSRAGVGGHQTPRADIGHTIAYLSLGTREEIGTEDEGVTDG